MSGSEEGCIGFLQKLGIPMKRGERWLSWSQLDPQSRRKVASAITVHMIKRGVGHRAARRLIGEVYTLTGERPGTEPRDAKEYSTLLNSCGRYDKAQVGLAVCKGDRGEALEAAKRLLHGHRRNLVEMLAVVRELGIQTRSNLQYFSGGDRIMDSVVGIVAGMVLGSKEMDADPQLPIFGLADSSEDPDMVKVSGRTTRKLVDRGVNLGRIMAEAASAVEGVAGGHNIAAGAKIPRGTEEEFLTLVDGLIGKALGSR